MLIGFTLHSNFRVSANFRMCVSDATTAQHNCVRTEIRFQFKYSQIDDVQVNVCVSVTEGDKCNYCICSLNKTIVTIAAANNGIQHTSRCVCLTLCSAQLSLARLCLASAPTRLDSTRFHLSPLHSTSLSQN